MTQNNPAFARQPEPWLRGTLAEIPAVPRAVLHALQLAMEDIHSWCERLSEEELHARVQGLPSVAFQIRHIGRSIDRLLTYAEGQVLNAEQMANLKSEADSSAEKATLFRELDSALEAAMERVKVQARADLEQARYVGKKKLPTTLGGLLVHVADHTQRHVGQAITTTKLVLAQRESH